MDNFETLSTLQLPRSVEIRGFAYQAKETGEWILADAPNAPSCCVGTARYKGYQVHLAGITEDLPFDKAITVTGTLIRDKGELILTHAEIQSASFNPLYLLVLLFPVILLIRRLGS